jgi:hypothetical protein
LYRLGAAEATIGAEVADVSAPKSKGEGREIFGEPKTKYENSG